PYAAPPYCRFSPDGNIPQHVRFQNEEPAAADVADACQCPVLRNLGNTECPAISAPEILARHRRGEQVEVDSPDDILRLREIQSGEGNADGGGPPDVADARRRCPHAVPSGIKILPFGAFLFGNQSVELRAERVELEYIGVAAIVSCVNRDREVIVQILLQVSAQFGGHDTRWIRVVTRDPEINLVAGVQNADFGFPGRRLALIRLALPEVAHGLRLMP